MRIAVIYPPPFLDSTPCLYNLVQSLADTGYALDVFTGTDPRFTNPKFTGNVTVHFFRGSRRQFPQWLAGEMEREGIGAIIAMDRWGMLAAAYAMRLSRKVPLIYFNVELYLAPIFTGGNHRAMNFVEAWLVRRMAQLSLAPSHERGAALAQWYGLSPDTMMTMPNSPRGAARLSPTDYLRRKYGIEPHRPIVLYFGSLTSANRIEELMESARSQWPEDIVLVLHGRQQTDDEGRRWFLERTKDAQCRIILSLDPLELEELDEMVRSADLGLALYPTEGVGFETMGTSSGKIAQYLHCGVPVITSNVQSLQTIFLAHPKAGRVVGHADEIPARAKELLALGPAAKMAAIQCFEDRFSFDRHFDAFLARFREITA